VSVSRRLCISGDPKYGIPLLDPISIQEASVKDSGITIIARDFIVEGIRDAVLQDMRYLRSLSAHLFRN
jgi:hypothetical protein